MRLLIAMALVWGGYTVGMWGYCLLNAYDVTFGDLFATTWPGSSGNSVQPGEPAKAQQGGGSKTENP